MSEELKQFGLYKIISGIVIFGIGIITMMVILVVNAENDIAGGVDLVIGISLLVMFVLFYFALRVIGGMRERKLKELVMQLKGREKEATAEDIAQELKVKTPEVEQYY